VQPTCFTVCCVQAASFTSVKYAFGYSRTDRPGITSDVDLKLLLSALLIIIIPNILKSYADPHHIKISSGQILALTRRCRGPTPAALAAIWLLPPSKRQSDWSDTLHRSFPPPQLTAWAGQRWRGGDPQTAAATTRDPLTPGCPRTAAPTAGCGRPCTCPAPRPSRPPAHMACSSATKPRLPDLTPHCMHHTTTGVHFLATEMRRCSGLVQGQEAGPESAPPWHWHHPTAASHPARTHQQLASPDIANDMRAHQQVIGKGARSNTRRLQQQ
jgi:hypothetical protein